MNKPFNSGTIINDRDCKIIDIKKIINNTTHLEIYHKILIHIDIMKIILFFYH